MSRERRIAYAMSCCWVCHDKVMIPLHGVSLRALGCHMMHRDCFHEDVFEQLGASIVYLVHGHQATGAYCPKFEKRRLSDPVAIPDPLPPTPDQAPADDQ